MISIPILKVIANRASICGPALIFDLCRLRKNFENLSSVAKNSEVELLFPVKAFSAPEVLQMASETFAGFHVSNEPGSVLVIDFPATGCRTEITILSQRSPYK